MAKTQDEINELLASDLFQKGIQDILRIKKMLPLHRFIYT